MPSERTVPPNVDGDPVPDTGFNPFTPTDAADPKHKLEELRRTCPVARVDLGEEGQPRVVTRYDDVVRIYRDWESFGNLGVALSREAHEAVPMEKRLIIALDPPEHGDVRQLVLFVVNRAAVNAAAPFLEREAAALVDRFATDGEAELVHQWAGVLPAIAITHLLGLPQADSTLIHEWVASNFSDTATSGTLIADAGALGERLDNYLQAQLDERREGPITERDALGQMLVFETKQGRRFTDAELCTQIRNLLLAGNETSTSLLSNMVYAMLTEPGVYERVASDHSLIPALADESLRLEPPLQVIFRICNRNAVVGESTLERDDIVLQSNYSANRDENVWGPDADEFRLDRFLDASAPHLSFGFGIHFCVGAHLARTTAKIALEALLERTQNLRLAPDYEYQKVPYFMFRRPRELRVLFDPVPRPHEA